MTRQEFLNEIAELLELPSGSLQGPESLEENGWSSLSAVSFIALVDEKLQASVRPADLANCETVEDLVNLVSARISG